MKLFESGDIALATNVGDKHIFHILSKNRI
jgi:hypothetical protein